MDTEETQVKEAMETKTLTNWQAVGIGIMIGLIPMVLSFLFFSVMLFSVLYGVALSFAWGTPMGILGGIIGALIGKSWRNTRGVAQIGAILGTALGIGVGLLLAILGLGIGIPQ